MLDAVRMWNVWFGLLSQAALLGLEAQRFALRLMRLPAGGFGRIRGGSCDY
jgi:hypothetical protein